MDSSNDDNPNNIEDSESIEFTVESESSGELEFVESLEPIELISDIPICRYRCAYYLIPDKELCEENNVCFRHACLVGLTRRWDSLITYFIRHTSNGVECVEEYTPDSIINLPKPLHNVKAIYPVYGKINAIDITNMLSLKIEAFDLAITEIMTIPIIQDKIMKAHQMLGPRHMIEMYNNLSRLYISTDFWDRLSLLREYHIYVQIKSDIVNILRESDMNNFWKVSGLYYINPTTIDVDVHPNIPRLVQRKGNKYESVIKADRWDISEDKLIPICNSYLYYDLEDIAGVIYEAATQEPKMDYDIVLNKMIASTTTCLVTDMKNDNYLSRFRDRCPDLCNIEYKEFTERGLTCEEIIGKLFDRSGEFVAWCKELHIGAHPIDAVLNNMENTLIANVEKMRTPMKHQKSATKVAIPEDQ